MPDHGSLLIHFHVGFDHPSACGLAIPPLSHPDWLHVTCPDCLAAQPPWPLVGAKLEEWLDA